MPRINTPDDYEVEIRKPQWEPCGQEHEAKMALALPGYCEINGEEHHITAYMYFVPSLIQSGANTGKPMYDVCAETCIRLGMSEPFNPINIDQLDGKRANFCVKEEEYKGKVSCKVAFINPPGRPKLEDKEVVRIWNELSGNTEPAPGTDNLGLPKDDELPF